VALGAIAGPDRGRRLSTNDAAGAGGFVGHRAACAIAPTQVAVAPAVQDPAVARAISPINHGLTAALQQ
jgi:hypothetical protein